MTVSKKIANKMIKETNNYMRSQCRAINKQLIEESKPPKKVSNNKKNNTSKAQEPKKNNKRQIKEPVTVTTPIKIGFWVMMACYLFRTLLGC